MDLNAMIKELFTGFKVNNITIPVSYMQYINKKGEPYIVFSQYDKDNSYSGDDEILGYISYYDFDIYSKSNYLEIIEAVKKIMKSSGWTWQPRRDSPDFYESDTKYFHKTLCFAYPIQEEAEEPEEDDNANSITENNNNIEEV